MVNTTMQVPKKKKEREKMKYKTCSVCITMKNEEMHKTWFEIIQTQ